MSQDRRNPADRQARQAGQRRPLHFGTDEGGRPVSPTCITLRPLCFMFTLPLPRRKQEPSAWRPKAALVAAKARGVVLGGDRGYRPETPPDWTKGVPAASAARTQRADHSAHVVLPIIEAMRVDGISSLSGIAAALNERGVPTPREGQWTATAVRRLLARVDPASAG